MIKDGGKRRLLRSWYESYSIIDELRLAYPTLPIPIKLNSLPSAWDQRRLLQDAWLE